MKMLARSGTLGLIVIWALSTWAVQKAEAQTWPQRNWNPLMLDNRGLGQSLAPRPNMMFGGIQTGVSGNFLYIGRLDGAAAFASPAPRINTGMIDLPAAAAFAAPPATLPIMPSIGPSAPVYNQSELPVATEFAPQPYADTNQPSPEFNESEDFGAAEQGEGPAEPGFGAAAGAGMPAVASAIVPSVAPSVRLNAVAPSIAAAEQYARSPELSERLTRIARDKSMLAGQGIEVYLGHRVVLLRGTVRTGRDRDLLASVVGLEPGVQLIDNRLVVAGSAPAVSNPTGR